MKSHILRVALSIIIVILLSLSNSLAGAAVPCVGDFEPDGDVDGSDLVFLINSSGLDLESFVLEFGRTDCAVEAQITLSPRALIRTAIQGLNPDLDLQSLTVRNTGNTTLEYNIAYDAGWLDISPVAGSLNSDESDNIPVSYDVVTPAALDPGTYHATITVSGTTPLTGEPVPDRSVDVTLTVISSPAQFIIDNDDPGTSYSGDEWGYSSGADPYGDSSRAASVPEAIYTFEGTVAGRLDVFLWWTWFESRCSDVPVDIYDGTTLLDTVEVNQQDQDLAGDWNLLGTYPFSGTARVVIRAQNGCSACADAVKLEYITPDPFVVLATPQNYSLQTFPDLYMFAAAGNLDAGWGIKFVLDMGTLDEMVIVDYAEPYEWVFSGLTQAEHTLDTYVVNGSESIVSGSFTHDQSIQIGIGKYYVAIGDSITEGYGDDVFLDDVSLDGRNARGGFTPILNNLLTAATGIPHTIVNEGVGGWMSSDGVGAILAQLSRHPDSQRFLVQYGTNDSDPYLFLPILSGIGLSSGDPGYPGSFKENMQIIIDAIKANGKEVCLSKLPITLGDTPTSTPYSDPDDPGTRNDPIKEYNDVIDELKNDPLNHITVIPPDLYSLFNEDVPGGKRYESEYYDNLHPDGIGYPSMANEWLESIAP